MENLDILNDLSIPNINDKTNFWLIRTQKGVFYNEYINDSYIALGWNYILEEDIKKSKVNKEAKDQLYEEIREKDKTERPGTPYNKCDKFINEIKEGDIIMIPSYSSLEISFARVLEYYEDKSFSYEQEKEVISRIKNGEDEYLTFLCPYSKRRRIEVIQRVPAKFLNVNLYKALVSYHGISNINNYAPFILSSMYSLYYYKDSLSCVYRITNRKDINPKDYSSFIFNVSAILEDVDPKVKLAIQTNVNSPGDIVIHIIDASNYISEHLTAISLVYFAIGGGKIGPIEIPSLLKLIIDISNKKKSHAEIEKTKAETELTKVQTKEKELDIKIKEYEFNKKIEEDRFLDIKKTSARLQVKTDVSEPLKEMIIESIEQNN